MVKAIVNEKLIDGNREDAAIEWTKIKVNMFLSDSLRSVFSLCRSH